MSSFFTYKYLTVSFGKGHDAVSYFLGDNKLRTTGYGVPGPIPSKEEKN